MVSIPNRKCEEAAEPDQVKAVSWRKAVGDELKAGQQIILHNLFKLPSAKYFIKSSVHQKIRSAAVPDDSQLTSQQLPGTEQQQCLDNTAAAAADAVSATDKDITFEDDKVDELQTPDGGVNDDPLILDPDRVTSSAATTEESKAEASVPKMTFDCSESADILTKKYLGLMQMDVNSFDVKI